MLRKPAVFLLFALSLFWAACATPPVPTPTSAPTPTPQPTATPTPVPPTFDTYESELLGFAIQHPDSWIVEANEENGAITISTEAGLLQAQDLPDEGAVVAVLFIRDELLETVVPAGATPRRTNQLGVLALVQPLFFQPEDGARQESDPREIEINDLPAAQVDLATGINAQEVRFTLTTFGAEEQIVAVITAAPAVTLDLYQDTLETMVNSITLSTLE